MGEDEPDGGFGGFLRRFPEFLVALTLFVCLTGLSWRRWASFEGDLNREWTTPARIAAGERLYQDVAYYYGPLVPWVEGGAFRLFGSRTGTAIGFGLLLAASLLTLILAGSRPFLTPWARVATASVITGVFAFAPNNGALLAPYSLSAVAAMALSWAAILSAYGQRASLAGLLAGLALLAKIEAAPVCVLLLLLLPGRLAIRTVAVAAIVAVGGYGWAIRGLAVEDLVTFGPLRHLSMPPEFRELYLRISGLHPAMRWGAAGGVAAGAALVAGWGVLAAPRQARSLARLATGCGLLLTGLGIWIARWPEPFLTTSVRGLPALAASGAVISAAAFGFSPRRFFASTVESRLPFVVCLTGLAFLWRTILWVVPSYPYAPIAALSAVPAAAYLLQRLGAAGPVPWLPLVLAPVFMLPRLLDFYWQPRVEIRTEAALWYLPAESGEVHQRVLDHLRSVGVKDRSLVVIPEASAINFALGVRSPVRLEQWLPGLLDARADAAIVAQLESSRPERVVWIFRATPEFGGLQFGRDYGPRSATHVRAGYVLEKQFHSGGQTAMVLRRKDLPAPFEPANPRP